MTSTPLYITHTAAGTVNRYSMGKVNNNFQNNFTDKGKLPVLWNKTSEGYKDAPSPSPKLPEQSQQVESGKYNAFYSRSNTDNAAGNIANSNYNHDNKNNNNNLHANEFRFNKRGVMNYAGVNNSTLDNNNNCNNRYQSYSCNTAVSPARSEHKEMTWEQLQKKQHYYGDKRNEPYRENCGSDIINNNNKSGQVHTRNEGYVTGANVQIQLPQQGAYANTPNRQREQKLQEVCQQSTAVQLTQPQTSNANNQHMNIANNLNSNVVPQVNHVNHAPTTSPLPPPPRNASPFVRSRIVVNSDVITNHGEHNREVSTSLPKLPHQSRVDSTSYVRCSYNSNEERVNGNYIKHYARVRPVDRGPQPMCVTPTRLPDGRRVVTEPRRMSLFGRKSVTVLDASNGDDKNNVNKLNHVEVKKEELLSEASQPKLKPLPGRRPPRNLTKRKQMKLTVGNDDSWMKGLTDSTWITSPVENRPLAVPYKRVPNKKRSQKRHKRRGSKTSHESCQGNAALHDTKHNSEKSKETFWQRLRDMFSEEAQKQFLDLSLHLYQKFL